MNSCNLSKEECKFSPNGINSGGTVEYKQNCVLSLQQQKSKYLSSLFMHMHIFQLDELDVKKINHFAGLNLLKTLV